MGIGGEEHRVERAAAHTGAKRGQIDGAIEAEQAADAVERDAEAKLNRREFDGDDDQQAEAARPGDRVAVRHLGVQQSNRGDADGLQLQLQTAGVLAFRLVDEKEPAARDGAGVNRQAEAIGETQADTRARTVERDAQADALHEPVNGSDVGTAAQRGFRAYGSALRAQSEIELGDLDNRQIDVEREGELERPARAATVDGESLAFAIRDRQIEPGLELFRQNLLQQRVAIVRRRMLIRACCSSPPAPVNETSSARFRWSSRKLASMNMNAPMWPISKAPSSKKDGAGLPRTTPRPVRLSDGASLTGIVPTVSSSD